MNILDNIKGIFKNHFEKRKQQREEFEKLQRQADMEAKIVFEREFIQNAKEVAIAKAKRDAAKLSGIQKLRAENRLRNLNKQGASRGGFLEKLSEHTQRNLANREENLKKTEIMRTKAKQMREEKFVEQKRLREERTSRNLNKPIGYIG